MVDIPGDVYNPSRYTPGGGTRTDAKDDGTEVGRCGTIQNRLISGLDVTFNAAGEKQYKKRAR